MEATVEVSVGQWGAALWVPRSVGMEAEPTLYDRWGKEPRPPGSAGPAPREGGPKPLQRGVG